MQGECCEPCSKLKVEALNQLKGAVNEKCQDFRGWVRKSYPETLGEFRHSEVKCRGVENRVLRKLFHGS